MRRFTLPVLVLGASLLLPTLQAQGPRKPQPRKGDATCQAGPRCSEGKGRRQGPGKGLRKQDGTGPRAGTPDCPVTSAKKTS